MNIDIIFEDELFLVVNKPSGLLVHLTPLDKKVTESLETNIAQELKISAVPVHRIDRPTSGVVVFIKERKYINAVAVQFSEHSVDKVYCGICRGWTETSGRIDYRLKKLEDSKGQKIKDGKSLDAVTLYSTLRLLEFPWNCGDFPSCRYSMCEIHPHTGKYRQIRRHFKHIFHPLIGDTTFGDGFHNRLFRENLKISRLLLHSRSLTLMHPITGEKIKFEAPLPKEFDFILKTGKTDIDIGG
ncbi:MAG: hypothetical protein JXR95_04225 [Deltaproteobacteria bacterium]|nr:hypothetical protein [Deltaproteobacteria bacterium]